LAWLQQHQTAKQNRQLAGGLSAIALPFAGMVATAFGAALLTIIISTGSILPGGVMAADNLNQTGIALEAIQFGGLGGND
jgi:hypothetical protein